MKDRTATIKAIIIDDEQHARAAVRNMVNLYCSGVKVLGEADGVAAGLECIEKFDPDLVFLDVEMADGTGFDLLARVGEVTFAVIFITAHEQYALRAIRFSALDYILKPVQPDELIQAVEKAIRSRREELNLKLQTYTRNVAVPGQPPATIILNTAGSIYRVEVADIVRCESDENYTRIFFPERDPILVTKTLKEFEELLCGYGFVRIHQSHIVNLNYVQSYLKGLGGMVILKNKERIPVSARRKELFLKAMKG